MFVCSRIMFRFLSFLFPVFIPCCDVALLERQWCQIVGWTGWTQGLEGSGFPSNKNHARKATLLIHYSCLFSSGLNNTEDLNAKYISDSESFLVDGIIANGTVLKNFLEIWWVCNIFLYVNRHLQNYLFPISASLILYFSWHVATK